MSSERKLPDWVETEADKVLCDIMLRHDSANIDFMYFEHCFSDPVERQKLIDGGNVSTYVLYMRDLHQKAQKIVDLIAASEYRYLLRDV